MFLFTFFFFFESLKKATHAKVLHLEQGDLFTWHKLSCFISGCFSTSASLFLHTGEQSVLALLSCPAPLGKVVFVLSLKCIKIKAY